MDFINTKKLGNAKRTNFKTRTQAETKIKF